MGTSPTRTSTCAAGTSLKAFLAFLDRFVSSHLIGSRLDCLLNTPHCDFMFGVLGLLGQVCLKCFRAARGQQKESVSSV